MKYLFLALPLLLGACSTLQGTYQAAKGRVFPGVDTEKKLLEHKQCPQVIIAENLGTFHDFAPRVKRIGKNLKSTATLQLASSDCTYDKNQVTVDITLDFNGKLGPKGRLYALDAPLYSYPFFVAITNPVGEIVIKQIFAATMPYPSTGRYGKYAETIRETLPITSQRKAKKYAVIVGFQLTEQQLAENRAYEALQKGEAMPTKAPERASKAKAAMPSKVAPKASKFSKPDPRVKKLVKPVQDLAPSQKGLQSAKPADIKPGQASKGGVDSANQPKKGPWPFSLDFLKGNKDTLVPKDR